MILLDRFTLLFFKVCLKNSNNREKKLMFYSLHELHLAVQNNWYDIKYPCNKSYINKNYYVKEYEKYSSIYINFYQKENYETKDDLDGASYVLFDNTYHF